ncbi:MAG: hypothetical protein ABUL57_02950, partial [Chloroflexota bacterium]
MSRRCHHGSPRHAQPGRVLHRPAPGALKPSAATPPAPGAASAPAQPLPTPPIPLEPVELREVDVEVIDAAPAGEPPRPAAAPQVEAPRGASAPLPVPPRPFTNGGGHPGQGHRPASRPAMNGNGAEHHDAEAHDGDGGERGATGPQLRRFIKSRAYVPMHELRRRFVINGADDEVTPVDLGERRRIFVGLPEREGRLLGELLRGGDIGYELSLDPISP